MPQAGLFQSTTEVIRDDKYGRLIVIPDAIAPDLADDIFIRLRKETTWQQDQIRIAGRWLPIPRLQAWYGDVDAGYSYSGLALRPSGWTPVLLALKAGVEQLSGATFNSVLLNLYRDGQDSVGWHSDDEPELGPQPVIASLSLGASRDFSLRRKPPGTEQLKIRLDAGVLLVMSGAFQHCWQHQVPKTAVPVGERINLTFRSVQASEAGFST